MKKLKSMMFKRKLSKVNQLFFIYSFVSKQATKPDSIKIICAAGNDKGTNAAESNSKEISVPGENIKESRNDCEGSNTNEFDFAMFAKAVSNPSNQVSLESSILLVTNSDLYCLGFSFSL